MRHDLWQQFVVLWGASALVVGLTQWRETIAPPGHADGTHVVRVAPGSTETSTRPTRTAASPPTALPTEDHLQRIVEGRRLAGKGE